MGGVGEPDVGVASHDYDTRCENGSWCGRSITAYIAEVKGNGAYGNRDGVIGTFDIIWRQNFQGPYPQWRLAVDWDSGPRIHLQEYKAQCRRHISGSSDAYCGSRLFYPGSISSSSRRSYSPSSSGYKKSGTRLSGSTSRKYHDDLTGTFHAAGYTYAFRAGTLHTGHWRNCGSSTGCRYYQVPWTSSP